MTVFNDVPFDPPTRVGPDPPEAPNGTGDRTPGPVPCRDSPGAGGLALVDPPSGSCPERATEPWDDSQVFVRPPNNKWVEHTDTSALACYVLSRGPTADANLFRNMLLKEQCSQSWAPCSGR